MRKDVECTFGILKKRWRVLNNGLMYQDIKVCEGTKNDKDIVKTDPNVKKI